MEIDEDAILALVDAMAGMCAELRRVHATPARPVLTIVQSPKPCHVAVGIVAAYWLWVKIYPCACQWHLAFEIHPIYRFWHWSVAAGASGVWQLWDKYKPEHVPLLPHFSYRRAA